MDPQVLMSLLAARNGGALPSGMEDPQVALARMAQNNPTVAALLQMMEAQKGAAVAHEPIVVEGTAVDVTDNEIGALHAQLEAAYAEVKLLRDRCDTLAAALGACGVCWGQDFSCRACRGHGAPGRMIPDQELFSEFVVPAVRLMHASRQRSNNVGSFTRPSAVKTDSTPMQLSN
jgi:hypothetical protein